MGKALRVLIVEDFENDALRLIHEFRRGGYEPVFSRVDTAEAMKAALEHEAWDLIIADYTLAQFSGLAALEIMQASRLDPVFILVSDTVGENKAAAAIKAGAHDYIMKGNLVRLIPAVERELRESEVKRKRRRAETKLKESEMRKSAILESAFDGIITIDQEGSIVEFSPSAEEMFGYDGAAVRGKDIADLIIPPDLREKHRQGLRRYFETGKKTVVGKWREERAIRADGTEFPVELTVTPVQLGDRMLFTAFIHDITERHRAAARLRLQGAALEAAADSIVITNREGTIHWVNPAFTALTGYEFSDVRDQNPRFLKSDKQDPTFYKHLWDTILSGKTWYGVLINKRKDGSLYLEEQAITPVFNKSGEIAHFVAIKRDITERKCAETEMTALLEENRRLAHRSIAVQEEERRTLAHELHDELGQCLTAIQADAEIISMESKGIHPEIHNSAQTIVTVSRQIYDVVRRIMQRLRPMLLDELGLLEALEESVTQWQNRYPAIIYELYASGELDNLGEKTNITVYRIVQECLTNVAKHAKATHVIIGLCRHLDQTSKSDVLELVVEDNGKGMNVEVMHNGLGLLGMRERALAVGGKFTLDSDRHQGVSISVHIPLAKSPKTLEESINAD